MIRRAVTRETTCTVLDGGKLRRVFVTIDPRTGTLEFRLKGTRRRYYRAAAALYVEACRLFVAAEKEQRARDRRRIQGKPARPRTVARGAI